MTLEETDSLPPGLYLVFWHDGTTSTAVVSIDGYDYRRLMCSDWRGHDTVRLGLYAPKITKMTLLI